MSISNQPTNNLVLATRNLHKAGEIRAILAGVCRCQTLNDFPGAPAVVEDAATFAGNANKKAVQLAEWLARTRKAESANRNLYVLADDSGLEVDALQGAPGVYSARFAALDESGDGSGTEGNSPDAANNAKLLRLLENLPLEKRTARFRCVLALAEVVLTPHPLIFEGVCEGRIGFTPRGVGGFGYDPLFVPTGHDQSFAELGEAVKNHLSHRAKALEKLQEWLRGGVAGRSKFVGGL